MRKITNLFVLLIAMSSCYRAAIYPEDKTPLTFDVSVNGMNLKDSIPTFDINNNGTLDLDLQFTRLTGNASLYPVTMYIDSMPANLSGSKDSFVFKLNHYFKIQIKANTDTGTFVVRIKVLTPSGGLQVFPVRLHTLPPPNYAECMAGAWSAVSCDRAGSCTSYFTPIDSMPGWATISNFGCLGDSIVVRAFFSATGVMVIPQQTTHGYTIYGSLHGYPCGHYQASLPISDTIIHNGDTQNCQFYINNF